LEQIEAVLVKPKAKTEALVLEIQQKLIRSFSEIKNMRLSIG
jgi:hypothetical protein